MVLKVRVGSEEYIEHILKCPLTSVWRKTIVPGLKVSFAQGDIQGTGNILYEKESSQKYNLGL